MRDQPGRYLAALPEVVLPASEADVAAGRPTEAAGRAALEAEGPPWGAVPREAEHAPAGVARARPEAEGPSRRELWSMPRRNTKRMVTFRTSAIAVAAMNLMTYSCFATRMGAKEPPIPFVLA